MNFKFLKAGALAATLALASLAAHADTYNFSYVFDGANTGDGNPVTITGYLSGDLVGDIVNNISDIHVSLNGTEFSGAPLTVVGWNETTGNWDQSVAPVVSTNGALNSFIFADANAATNPDAVTNYFWFVDGQVMAITLNQVDAGNNPLGGVETADNAKWTLVAAPVPEPASYAMLAAGLGLMGFVARRRQS